MGRSRGVHSNAVKSNQAQRIQQLIRCAQAARRSESGRHGALPRALPKRLLVNEEVVTVNGLNGILPSVLVFLLVFVVMGIMILWGISLLDLPG